MQKSKVLQLVVIALVVLIMGACLPGLPFGPDNTNLQNTAVVQTVSARLTQEAFARVIAQLTEAARATPIPQPTAIPTLPPIPPTPIPPPTAFPTLQPTPPPCNWAQFIQDVTIPDGTVFGPEDNFVKIWRLRNIGSCTWMPDYSVVFVNGNAMSSPAVMQIGATVRPGDAVDVAVRLIAPREYGDHVGRWMLRSHDGVVFGLGERAQGAFWVNVRVDRLSSGIEQDRPIRLAQYYCQARWHSSRGLLRCPSTNSNDFTNGSITMTTSPKLEGGYNDDQPSLIMIPSDGMGGFISGRFPAIQVHGGDHLTGLIGCYYNTPYCDVTFTLNYQIEGDTQRNLVSWRERHDGQFTRVDVDLSSLAGRTVEFIISVQNNNSSRDDKTFWMEPLIERR